jgi:nucleotide-binding universal stress UspA family protein
MSTLKKILVPTDFSECSEAAMRYGFELAHTFDATLHLLHVVEDPDTTPWAAVNRPSLSLGRLIARLRSAGRLTLESMFVRDAHGRVDNTVPQAIDAWLKAVDRIQPAAVDIQPSAPRPVQPSLVKVPEPVLE